MKVDAQLPKLDSPAHQALNAALANAASHGQIPACAAWGADDNPWLSDDAAEREWAASICRRCPVIEECYGAGELERFGVWGGVDRTPPSSSKSLRKPNPPAENTHLQEIS